MSPADDIDLIARPIRFTSDVSGWTRILDALGGARLTSDPSWTVYQMGSGRLALHAANGEHPPASTLIALETRTELAAAVERIRAAGAPIALETVDHGEAGVVRAADGTVLTLDSPTPGDALPDEKRLGIQLLWFGVDTVTSGSVFEALGARPRIVADAGGWADFTCSDGGLLCVHHAEETEVDLGFEWDGPLEEAKALLDGIGLESALIDETYGRSLRFKDPDGGEIWINERQRDLYGYSDLS